MASYRFALALAIGIASVIAPPVPSSTFSDAESALRAICACPGSAPSSATAAWRSPEGELTYALEGAIFVTGAAVQWLRDGLQIVGSAAETAAIAATAVRIRSAPRATFHQPHPFASKMNSAPEVDK